MNSKVHFVVSGLRESVEATVGERVRAMVPIVLADANSVFDVLTASGRRWVVRVLRTQSQEGADQEDRLFAKLRAGGLRAPALIHNSPAPTSGGQASSVVHHHGAVRYTVAPRLAGRHPSVSLDGWALVCAALGTALASTHAALDGSVVTPSAAQWLDPGNALRSSRAVKWINESVEQRVSRSAPNLVRAERRTILHGDLSPFNVLVEDGQAVAVLDLETAQAAAAVLDVARTVLVLGKFDLPTSVGWSTAAAAVVGGYLSTSVSSLPDNDLLLLPDAVTFVGAACAAWCAERARPADAVGYLRASDDAASQLSDRPISSALARKVFATSDPFNVLSHRKVAG